MLKRSRRPSRDVDEIASRIPVEVTGRRPKMLPPQKDPAAVSLGRRGGLKGGKARAAKMTKKQRSESARKAALARWKDAKGSE